MICFPDLLFCRGENIMNNVDLPGIDDCLSGKTNFFGIFGLPA